MIDIILGTTLSLASMGHAFVQDKKQDKINKEIIKELKELTIVVKQLYDNAVDNDEFIEISIEDEIHIHIDEDTKRSAIPNSDSIIIYDDDSEIDIEVFNEFQLEITKLYIYINIIKADGVIDNNEVIFFNKLLEKSKLNEKIKQDIYNELHSSKEFDIEISHLLIYPETIINNIITNVINIAACDGYIHKKEKEFIYELAKKLKIPRIRIDDMLSIA